MQWRVFWSLLCFAPSSCSPSCFALTALAVYLFVFFSAVTSAAVRWPGLTPTPGPVGLAISVMNAALWETEFRGAGGRSLGDGLKRWLGRLW